MINVYNNASPSDRRALNTQTNGVLLIGVASPAGMEGVPDSSSSNTVPLYATVDKRRVQNEDDVEVVAPPLETCYSLLNHSMRSGSSAERLRASDAEPVQDGLYSVIDRSEGDSTTFEPLQRDKEDVRVSDEDDNLYSMIGREAGTTSTTCGGTIESPRSEVAEPPLLPSRPPSNRPSAHRNYEHRDIPMKLPRILSERNTILLLTVLLILVVPLVLTLIIFGGVIFTRSNGN